MRIVVTGTPGVGKHTIAKALAERLRMSTIDINELALSNNAVIGKDRFSYIVDTDKLRSILKGLKDNTIVVGHLAPYVLDSNDVDLVVVLRRSPYELREIYKERRYDESKAKDNLASEILGIITYDSVKQFKDKVVEIDCTSKNVDTVVDEILRIVNKKQEGMLGHIDWLALVVKNNDLREFFDY